jgi:hypothetical protein
MPSFVTSFDVLFKIALAAIAAYVSYQFGSFKQQNEDIKLVVELAFASEPRTAAAGVLLAGKYAEQERIPTELYVSIITSASSNGTAALRATATTSVDEVSQNNVAVAKQINKALDALPSRVYFHISREEDRGRAIAIQNLLQEQSGAFSQRSLIVPGPPELVKPMSETQVRCFKKEECDALGVKLVDFLTGIGTQAKLVDLSQRYANTKNIRPNHFEIWFSPLS